MCVNAGSLKIIAKVKTLQNTAQGHDVILLKNNSQGDNEICDVWSGNLRKIITNFHSRVEAV